MSSEDQEKKPVSVGPWGGQDGTHWDDGVYSTVRQLVISHGSAIDSVQIEYDKKGSSMWSERHGGNGGKNTDKVKLNYPDEFLTSVHGYYGSLYEWGPIIIRSLTFESNKKTYGPFGVEKGTSFSFQMTGGKIVGFHGKSGWYLDAIGVYLKPLQKVNSSNKSLVHSQSYLTTGTEKVGYSVFQGSGGQSFDILLALKQKDAFANPPPGILSRQTSDSQEFSDSGTKSRMLSTEKAPSKVDGLVPNGPWGGSGGMMFDDGTHTGIKQINLSRNIAIVSIKILYDLNGQASWGSKHGGTGGFKTDKIVFDYPSEILTHITGTYGPLMYMGPNIIQSLTFHTNKRKYGPYGEEQGPSFTSKTKEGKIVGFYGREGLFIDAIGVHLMECKVPPAPKSPPKPTTQAPPVAHAPPKPATQAPPVVHTPPKPTIQAPPVLRSPPKPTIPNGAAVAEIDNPPWTNKLVLAKQNGPVEEVAYGVLKEPAPYGSGPWGGDNGKPWDDGVFSGIKQIFVTKADAVCSIQIEYDRNGQSVWSAKHGGNGGTTTHRIKLEYPHEVLICVSGYYGTITREEKPKVIRSLTFETSRGKYGPFGEEIGTFFTSTKTEGKVVGFHGRKSIYLDAIGVHMQHWLGSQKTTKPSFFKLFN